MGMNAIRCEGYVDVKESGFGKENRTASDFNTTDVVAAAGMLALIGLASGCIRLNYPPLKWRGSRAWLVRSS